MRYLSNDVPLHFILESAMAWKDGDHKYRIQHGDIWNDVPEA